MPKISEKISTALGEYLILPRYSSKEVITSGVSLKVPLTKYAVGVEKPKLFLNIPFLSAAMQSVTNARMAVALAKFGGLGVIPCSQKIVEQAAEIRKVKSERAGFIRPETVSPESYIGELARKIEKRGYSTFPVTEDGKIDSRLVGLITKSDFTLEQHAAFKVEDRMIRTEEVIFAFEDEINGLNDAAEIISRKRISVLPVLDRILNLKYVVFRKDLDSGIRPSELLDKQNRYIVGGNFVTSEGFEFAMKLDVDAVKIGMGPGSICTTQDQKGVGRGQATAVSEIAEARDKYFKETGLYVPLIVDGGIEFSRHMIVALALGADSLMMGKWFARFDESAAPKVHIKGEWKKIYWGEGSSFARKWREERYGQSSFDEGIISYIPNAGSIRETNELKETIDKIKAAIMDTGSKNIYEFHKNAVLERVSASAITEATPHGVTAVMEEELLSKGVMED